MRQMADKGHLTCKYQIGGGGVGGGGGGVHCRERELEHVTKTACIEELRTCPETHQV